MDLRNAARNVSTVDGPENPAVELDDCQFHQCVKLGKFDNDRTISFIPPDGEFELMRYRSTTNINVPFKVHPIIEEIGKTRVEYTIQVKTTFSPKLNASSVVIKVPTPLNTAKVECKVSLGKAKYSPADNLIIWRYVYVVLTAFVASIDECVQDTADTGTVRYHFHCRSDTVFYDASKAVVSAADSCRFPGAHVYGFRIGSPFLEGI